MLRANLNSISLGRKSHWKSEYLFCLTRKVQHSSDQYTVLSISFEVDAPTGKVGSSLLFKRRRRELPRGVWNLDARKCYFQRFPDSIWALRTIKIKTILTIFYVYYNRSFPQKLNHWLWRGCHFRTCESLGSSPVKMSQALHDLSITSICFNFSYFQRKVNTFKTPEMCLYLDSDVWAGCFAIIFAGSFRYFKPVSCWILFWCRRRSMTLRSIFVTHDKGKHV